MSETKQLLEMLRDANPAIRRFALQRLGEGGDRTSIPSLRRATEDADPAVAGQAEKSLYLVMQQSVVGPSLHEKVVSIPGPAAGQVADVFELEPLQECGRQLLRPHAARMAKELDGDNPALARACASALGKIRHPEFIPELTAGLAREDRRTECAYALAALDSAKARAPLLALLASSDRQTIRLGTYALAGCRLQEAIQPLLALLMHPDIEVRTDVVFALGESGDSAISRKLVPLLDDRSDLVVIRTLAALRKLGYRQLPEAVLARWPTARNDRIRATLVGALADAPAEPRVLQALERAVHDPDTRVRANAVEVTGTLEAPKEVRLEILRHAMEDRNNRVMANLAIAMGSIDTLYSLRVLSEMLNSPDKWERASAVYAAGFVQEERIGLWLANIFMFEEDLDVLRNTVSSLSRYRGPVICEQLVKALRHHNPAVRSGAARVLGAMGERVGRDALLRALEVERDSDIRADLLAALGKLCDPSHIQPIAAALKDPSPQVQAHALEALEQIGSVEILPLVEPFLGSLDPRVKANAARALWKQGHLDVVTVLGGMLHAANPEEVHSAVYALGELGDALGYLADLRHFYLLASALRAKARGPGAVAVPLPPQSPALDALLQLLDVEPPLRFLYAGRYPEAINTLKTLLLANPRSVPGNYLVGDLYRRLENLELATRHLGAARAEDATFVNCDLHLASVSASMSDTRASIGHYLAALKGKLRVIGDVADAASRLLELDRVGDASLVLKALVQQVPIDSKLHYKMGVQLMNSGLNEGALEQLFLALLADPKDARVLLQFAILMAKLDQKMVLKKVCEWMVELVGENDPLAIQAHKLLDEVLRSGAVGPAGIENAG